MAPSAALVALAGLAVICPVCRLSGGRLATLRGCGWLEGRTWQLCFPCYNALLHLLDQAQLREAQGLLAPPVLNQHEEAICCMLGIDPAELEARLPPSIVTSW